MQSSSAGNVNYYYDAKFDDEYKKSKYFKRVDNNIEEIIKTLDKIKNESNEFNIAHIKDNLSEDDYYHLVDESDNEVHIRIFIYNTKEHALYYFKIWD